MKKIEPADAGTSDARERQREEDHHEAVFYWICVVQFYELNLNRRPKLGRRFLFLYYRKLLCNSYNKI